MNRCSGITQRLDALILTRDLGVHFRLMVVIPRQCGIDLGERKVRMILLNRLGVPTVAQMVERDFNDLDVGVVNPRPALVIEVNVRLFLNRLHAARAYGGKDAVTSALPKHKGALGPRLGLAIGQRRRGGFVEFAADVAGVGVGEVGVLLRPRVE